VSITQTPVTSAPPRRPVGQLVAATAARIRQPPSPRGLARRRIVINLTKWLLPAGALVLLASIALWPQFEHLRDTARMALQRISTQVAGATMVNARYHSVDDHNRPYTLTAATAQQDGPDRINLTTPKGDITLSNGTWLMVQSKLGVYWQHASQLDLSRDVTLYRDDGTTLVTASASLDLKAGAAAGAEPTHAEGPFGTLDAHGGFTITDKGSAIQFIGPAHLVLNGASP
jgi:lipopolysaccharide export system protein LptC